MDAIEKDFFTVKRGDRLASNGGTILGVALRPGSCVEIQTDKGDVTIGVSEPIMVAPECECGDEGCEWC